MRPNLAVLMRTLRCRFQDLSRSSGGEWMRVGSTPSIRLTEVGTDSVAFAARYRDALYAFDRNHPQQGSRLFVAVQLLDLGSPAEALARLQQHRSGWRSRPCSAALSIDCAPRSWTVGRSRSGLQQEHEPWWADRVALGATRTNRHAPGQDFRRREVFRERCSTRARERLLPRADRIVSDLATRLRRGGRSIRIVLALEPGRRSHSQGGHGAWQLAGNSSRVQQLYAEGVQAGLAPAPLLNGAGASDW